MSIILISAIAMDFGIGDENGNLLFNLPKDMEHFKSITTGKTVVMGRKTWDSLPKDKKPLPKRKNYILTRDENFKVDERVTVVHSIEEVLEISKSRDVYIIGGAEIYNQFMPYADNLIITHVHGINFNARAFFPDIDTKEWKIDSMKKHDADDEHEHSFTFAFYSKANKKQLN